MTINLIGVLINGDTAGIVANGGRLQNLQIAMSAPLTGTLTLTGAGGASVVAAPGSNGVITAPELYSPVFFKLSDPADVGKARVTWSPT